MKKLSNTEAELKKKKKKRVAYRKKRATLSPEF